MKILALFLLNSLHFHFLIAQRPECYLSPVVQSVGSKPPIDFDAIDRWQSFGNGNAISNDGSWFCYTIVNQPFGSQTLFIQSTVSAKKKEFAGYSLRDMSFSEDSRTVVLQRGDSVLLYSLLNENIHVIKHVKTLKTDIKDSPSYLAWEQKTEPGKVVLHEVKTGIDRVFTSVKQFGFSPSGKWLCLQQADGTLLIQEPKGGLVKQYEGVSGYQFSRNESVVLLRSSDGKNLEWVNLITAKRYIVMKNLKNGKFIRAMATDLGGSQLAFILEEKQGSDLQNTIWYYKPGMENAEEKVNNQNKAIEKGLYIGSWISFTDNGKYISFSIKEKETTIKPLSSPAQLDVWNYKDDYIQPAQQLWSDAKQAMSPQSYVSVADVNTGRVTVLGGKQIKNLFGGVDIKGDYALLKRHVASDRLWERNGRDSVWLVSLREGNRHFLKKMLNEIDFSIDGRYLLHFDESDGHYHSYDIAAGRWVNISAYVPEYLGSENVYDPAGEKNNSMTGIAGWESGGDRVLVYGRYDLWLLDMRGEKKPVNVTNGYGRREGVILRLTNYKVNNSNRYELTGKSSLLLTAFDPLTKENGFYRKDMGRDCDPVLLSRGDYIVDLATQGLMPHNSPAPSSSSYPIRSRDAAIWLVRKISPSGGINYYVSTDLKSFRPLTNLKPHTNYNWYRTQKIDFRQMDGSLSQGVLYKPENFDPTKKYPVIIHYYCQLTQRLHEYDRPYYTLSGWIDIPWFVSRGYLVFTPDIYFTKLTNGAGALNTVEGAAIHLSSLPYVDSLRLGVAGHSFGGGLTNYILTHSKRFAAAFEGAGVSNWTSEQGTLELSTGAARMSLATPVPMWEKRLIMESPIFHVEAISSPLLIFHCKRDGAVPFEQGVELFVAMRRQGKKVWMLQYDRGKHGLDNIKNKEDQQDLTVRVTQFFDHYLKGEPPPMWMTKGVPARLKGIETGLELDKSGDQP